MDKSSSNIPIIKEDNILQALTQAYQSMVNATELIILSINPEGIITSFNAVAEKLSGYKASEVVRKKSILKLLDAHEVKQRAAALSKESGTKIPPGIEAVTAKSRLLQSTDQFECTFIGKAATRIPVKLWITPFWNEEQLVGYSFVATNTAEKKQADEKIQQSESHLRALLSLLNEIILEVDEEGKLINTWISERSSMPKAKIKNVTLSQAFGEEFGSSYKEVLLKVILTNESISKEYKTVIDGKDWWFAARYSPIQQKELPTGTVSICIQNITEVKKTELALKESEEKFRLLAENIPGIIYLCNNDRNYSMIYINDKVFDITGYTKEEFVNSRIHIANLFHRDDAEYIYRTVDEALTERKGFHLKYRVRHKSGHYRWVEEYGTGVYNEQTLLWIEGFISDITKTKAAEEELLLVFNNTLSLNVIAGFDGYFKKLNPAWEKTLGWTIRELLERPYMEFIHPEDLKMTREICEQIKGGQDVSKFENRYRCKDGSYRWLLWTCTADVKQEIIYASALDITDRKRTEEALLHSKHNVETVALKLQEQNRQLDEFAHIISHNLRSPLGNIQALISFLNESSTIDDYKIIFDKLKNVSKNLTETMSELMDIMKIKKNTNIEKVELRFKDVLDKVIQSLEGDLIQCKASVTYDFNNAPKLIYSKTYLESIFQNLLSNALKYRSPDRTPEIYFESKQLDNQIELRVSDNGLGIDMERFGNKLFGLHKTFHVHKEAKGVGLFLTKTQIETLGGSIAAESEVDKGTTFIIRFNQ